MTEIILTALGAVLSLVGLTEIIHSFRIKLLTPKHRPQAVVTVYLHGDDADLQLIYAINKYKCNNLKMVAVLSQLDEEKKKICRKIAEKYDVEIID